MVSGLKGARSASLVACFVTGFCWTASAQQVQQPRAANTVPRTADGKPNLQGIWQAQSRAAYNLQYHPAKFGMPGCEGVVDGGEIPYQPWAGAKKLENFAKRANCIGPAFAF
jgi:hypothetical protein